MQETTIALVLVVGLSFVVLVAAKAGERTAAATAPAPATQPLGGATAQTADSPLDFTVADIDGNPVELSRYKGEVLLIVNVASRCGLTPQYKALEALHQKYREQGLRILAFPANDFMGQEPGSNQQIKEFCSTEYRVSFDLFAKVSVKGAGQCELYRYLTSPEKVGEAGGEIPWNFTKFLVARDGKVIQRFSPRTRPDDPALVRALEAALAAARG